jgi:hypothetical protein
MGYCTAGGAGADDHVVVMGGGHEDGSYRVAGGVAGEA